MTTIRNIDQMSCVSLVVEPIIQHAGCEAIECGPATGFVVEKEGSHFLVTNYHVVSGRRSTDGAVISTTGGTPTHLRCTFHGQKLGTWQQKIVPLFDKNDKPTWLHTVINGSDIFKFADVAVIPLEHTQEITLYPVAIDKSDDIRSSPCSQATVLGYPGGKSSYKYFPIWVTGYIASEPQLDYADLSILLVNATTTAGMSGSPVFQVADGNHFDSSGGYHISASRLYKFLGIYSGRITTNQLLEDSVTDDRQSSDNALNIGIVWKPSIINKLITHHLHSPIKAGV